MHRWGRGASTARARGEVPPSRSPGLCGAPSVREHRPPRAPCPPSVPPSLMPWHSHGGREGQHNDVPVRGLGLLEGGRVPLCRGAPCPPSAGLGGGGTPPPPRRAARCPVLSHCALPGPGGVCEGVRCGRCTRPPPQTRAIVGPAGERVLGPGPPQRPRRRDGACPGGAGGGVGGGTTS